MVLDAFKKYPSQISSAFRRFPVASALSFVWFAALIIDTEFFGYIDFFLGSTIGQFLIWLGIYPVAAMLISITTSLVQESLNNRSKVPQIVSGVTWFIISAAIVFFSFNEHQTVYSSNELVSNMILVAYATVFIGLFIAPFWKQKDENAFWNFLCKNIKALLVAALITGILLGSVEALVFTFEQLFDYEFDDKIYLYIFYFCISTVFPILYFAGIPSIRECQEKTPALNKFATSTIKFLFFPVLSLYIVLIYGYIGKIILIDESVDDYALTLVIGAMIFIFVLFIVAYPARKDSKPSLISRASFFFPIACIPLVMLMSAWIFSDLSDFGISEECIYILAINLFFYVTIFILTFKKIERKFRSLAIAFCAILLVVTNGPLSAQSIAKQAQIKNLVDFLTEEGFSDFPLSDEDFRDFFSNLQMKNIKQAIFLKSQIEELNSKYRYDLLAYVNFKGFPDPIDSCEDSTIVEASIHNPIQGTRNIPKNSSKFATFSHHFNEDEFDFRNDTLHFDIALDDSSEVYQFHTTRQELENKDSLLLATESATLDIETFDLNIGNCDSSLYIEGYIFLK